MDIPGAIAANQGTHQTSNVLTPWDVQSKRILSEDGPCPTLPSGTNEGVNIQPVVALQSDGSSSNGAQHGSGFNNDGSGYTLNGRDRQSVAYGFKFHQGAAAGGLGFQEEEPPTLTAGYHNPAVVTNYGDDLAGTLTSRADSSANPMGGQNVVCMSDTQSNTAIDGDVCGTLSVHTLKDPPVIAKEIDVGE